MTRDQFIDDYMTRSHIDLAHRTAVGFHVKGSDPRIAAKCSCSDPQCQGWAMIRLEDIDDLYSRSTDPSDG